MEVIKKKSGTVYRARVYFAGKSMSRVFASKKEALNWQATKRLSKSQNFEDQDTLAPTKLVSEAVEEWWTAKVSVYLSRKTQAGYKSTVNNYLVPWLGREAIGAIRKTHAEVFIKLLCESGLHPRTVNRHTLVLKQVMKFCFEQGWIVRNPLVGIREVPQPEQVFDFLSREEINSLLVANRHEPIYAVLILALNTGMRLGEVCGLCWDQVSFQSRQIVVRRSLTSFGLQERTKNKRIRHVPMNEEVYRFLMELRAKGTDSSFVCPTSKGKTWNVDHITSRGFKRALLKAGVRRVRFHDLRHTYASHFMMNGGSIYDLQKILGHADLKMTMRYAHLSPEHLLSASNVVRFNGESNEDLPQTSHKILSVL